ncbi:MAG: hypothetical protein WCQ91_01565 [Planctomycetota bacterium]
MIEEMLQAALGPKVFTLAPTYKTCPIVVQAALKNGRGLISLRCKDCAMLMNCRLRSDQDRFASLIDHSNAEKGGDSMSSRRSRPHAV